MHWYGRATGAEVKARRRYLSDIFEYMSADDVARVPSMLWHASRDGGVLSYREMMVPRSPPPAMAKLLPEDTALSRSCHARERAFFFGAHRVLRVRRAACPQGAS